MKNNLPLPYKRNRRTLLGLVGFFVFLSAAGLAWALAEESSTLSLAVSVVAGGAFGVNIWRRVAETYDTHVLDLVVSYMERNEFEIWERHVRRDGCYAGTRRVAVAELRAAAKGWVPLVVGRQIAWVVSRFVVLVLLLTCVCYALERSNDAEIFVGLSGDDGFVDHVYYVSVSISTLGYGGNNPKETVPVARIFVLVVTFATFLFLTMSINLFFGPLPNTTRVNSAIKEFIDECCTA